MNTMNNVTVNTYGGSWNVDVDLTRQCRVEFNALRSYDEVLLVYREAKELLKASPPYAAPPEELADKFSKSVWQQIEEMRTINELAEGVVFASLIAMDENSSQAARRSVVAEAFSTAAMIVNYRRKYHHLLD